MSPSKSQRRQSSRWFSSNEQQKNEDDSSSSSDSFEKEWSSKSGPKPVERTEIIEYSHKLCFSTQPVKKCPSGSNIDEEAQTKKQKVPFFCLDRSSSEARQMQRQVRQGRLVDVEGRAPSFVEELQQPTRCVRAY